MAISTGQVVPLWGAANLPHPIWVAMAISTGQVVPRRRVRRGCGHARRCNGHLDRAGGASADVRKMSALNADKKRPTGPTFWRQMPLAIGTAMLATGNGPRPAGPDADQGEVRAHAGQVRQQANRETIAAAEKVYKRIARYLHGMA